MTDKKTARISTFGSRATSVISVSMVLILIGALAIIGVCTRNAVANVQSSLTVIVRLNPGTELFEVNPLRQHLNTSRYAVSHTYTSATDVLAQEAALMGDSIFQILDENPYTDEIAITLKSEYINADSIKIINADLSKFDVVDTIDVPMNIAADVNNTVGNLSMILGGVALLLLIISIVLINNTVSLSIYARRFIIHTMRLVGATRSFVRKPFVKAGAACGAIAGVIAAVVLGGVSTYMSVTYPEVGQYVSALELTLILIALPIIGIVIAATTAWFAADRYLNKNYDQLFRK